MARAVARQELGAIGPQRDPLACGELRGNLGCGAANLTLEGIPRLHAARCEAHGHVALPVLLWLADQQLAAA